MKHNGGLKPPLNSKKDQFLSLFALEYLTRFDNSNPTKKQKKLMIDLLSFIY